MDKKVVVVNAGSRKGWNTDTLLQEAARGCEESGAKIEKFDLFRLERERSFFDSEHKKQRHQVVFPGECQKAYETGKTLIKTGS